MERQTNRRDKRVWCTCSNYRLLEGGGRFLFHTFANYHAKRDNILQTTFNIDSGVDTCIVEEGPIDEVCEIGSSSSNYSSQEEIHNEDLWLLELDIPMEVAYGARRHKVESGLLVKLIDI